MNWIKSVGRVLGASLLFMGAPAQAAGNSDADFAGKLKAIEAAVIKEARAKAAVLSDKTTVVGVNLNSSTVKCSRADYWAGTLKVLIPALAELTVLNHRNSREGAPCLAAGVCEGELFPETILKSGAGVDQVPIRVVLKKVTELDGAVCHVSIVETVTTVIRGVPFYHERSQPVADRDGTDCR